jgi:hypothetical protein
MPAVKLQIPLLFDISAGGIVFGETISDRDLFDAHFNFSVAGDSATALKNEFNKLLYSDAPSTDTSGVLFYSSEDNLSTSLGQQLGESILGEAAKLTQPSAAAAAANNDAAHDGKYMLPGIPLPNYGLAAATAVRTTTINGQEYYKDGLTDAGGTNFARILIRVMATHLMGHPFAQSFLSNEQAIIADISTNGVAAVKSQIESRLLVNDGALNSSTLVNEAAMAKANLMSGTLNDKTNSIYYAEKADGIRNQILQSIYEGLLGTDPARFDLSNNTAVDVSSNDVSGGTDFDEGNLDSSGCRPRHLPFEAGDTISFYFRPHVALSIDTDISGVGASYGNNDISGVGQGSSGVANTAIGDMFFQPRHRWISHGAANRVFHSTGKTNALAYADAGANAYDTYQDDTGEANRPGVTMMGTDLVSSVGAASACEFDGHVWKVTLTL